MRANMLPLNFTRPIEEIPEWVLKYPQTPLSELLFGKAEWFNHEVICSASRRKPIGTPGCICLRRLKRGDTIL